MYSYALHISNGGGKECTPFSHFDRGRRLHGKESRHSEIMNIMFGHAVPLQSSVSGTYYATLV